MLLNRFLFHDPYYIVSLVDIPSVVIQQPQYSVLVGNSITLVCTVTANPTHTSVNWRRTVNGVTTDIVVANSNNKYSGSTVSTPSLTINNAAQADEGNYVCYASNSIGTGQSSQTFLDVFGGKLSQKSTIRFDLKSHF